MSKYMYVSFVDEHRPEGNRWVGGCIVKAATPDEAMAESLAQECNPGGHVMVIPIDDEDVPAAKYHNVLLTTKEQVEEAFGCSAKSVGEWDAEGRELKHGSYESKQ